MIPRRLQQCFINSKIVSGRFIQPCDIRSTDLLWWYCYIAESNEKLQTLSFLGQCPPCFKIMMIEGVHSSFHSSLFGTTSQYDPWPLPLHLSNPLCHHSPSSDSHCHQILLPFILLSPSWSSIFLRCI